MTPDDSALVAQGRTYVRIAAAASVVVSAVSIAVYLVRLGPGKLPQQLVRFALTLGLAYALTRGRAWARWTTLVLLLLGMFVVVPVFRDPEAFRMPKLPATLFTLALFVTYGIIGRGLLYSASVRAFFRAAKAERAGGGAPAT
jgi:hypothetical protein